MKLSIESGVDGIVCSPHEIKTIRENFGDDIELIVPGVRRAEDAVGDQTRFMGPQEAVRCGANYLVIGRPITKSDTPPEVARDIFESLSFLK